MINKIIFFSPITELIICIYVLGWGLLVSSFFYVKEDIKKNLSEIAIFGFCLTLPITQFVNFFFPISELYFYISFLISIIILFKFKRHIKEDFLQWLIKLSLIFIILIPVKYVIKGNEDLYYHLPKLELLNEFKIIFGIAHFDPSLSFTNGWAHISSAFNFFNGASKNLYLTSFVFYILTIITFFNYLKKTDLNTLKILSLIIISFLLIKFYRIQEFGNDYHAIILLLFSQFLIFQYYLIDKKNSFLVNKIIFFTFFAIMFRIYSLFIIPTLFILLLNKKNIFKLINKKLLILTFISLSLTVFTSLINSGCIIMPIKQTCLNNDNISWSYINKIDNLDMRLKSMNTSYFSYKKEVKNHLSEEEWVKNFNWFSYHIKTERFLKPLSKTLVIIILLFYLSIILFNKKKLTHRILNKKDFYVIFFILLSFVAWLINTPLLRAGGFSYWPYLIISILLLKFEFNENLNLKKIKIFLLIMILITVSLNLNRIAKEGKKYQTFNPFFFTEWGKLHHMKYGYKETLKNIINNKKKIDDLKLYYKIKNKNGYWVISEL